jgi:hypothetical protein
LLTRWVGALTRAYESSQGRQPVEQYRPMTPMSEVSGPQRAMSIMSRDPEEYVEQHRVLSISRSRSQNPPERRRSFNFANRESLGSLQWQNGNRSQTDLRTQPKHRKSFMGKIKAFFSAGKDEEEKKEEDQDRGRTQENFASKLRRRSKSVTRFLFGSEE